MQLETPVDRCASGVTGVSTTGEKSGAPFSSLAQAILYLD